MENQKFRGILEGIPASLSSQEIMEFGAYCSSQSLNLDQFIEIARTLYKADRENCFEFLSFVEKHEMSRNSYKDFQHQPAKIQIYNCLMALTLSKALRENTKEGADALMNEARKNLNLSINVKMSAENTVILLRGFMTYFNGDFSNAFNIFIKSFQEGSSEQEAALSTISLLGLAQINFVKKSYAKSLEYYKKALISNKNLPSKARLGMGYCFYELQKYELAELCFNRIIKLDPKCADAFMGLAVIRYKDNDYQGYFHNLKIAYGLSPNNPLVVLHLAEHFFLSEQYQKSRILCEKGLKCLEKQPKFLKSEMIPRNDHEQFKIRFQNIMAQIHHINSEYEQATKLYAAGLNKGLLHNDVGLAQCYIQSNMLKEGLQILETMCVKGHTKSTKLVSDMFKTIGYLQVKVQAKPMSENGPGYYYRQALKHNPNDYETYIDYSVYLSENNREKALGVLLKARSLAEKTNSHLTPELLNNVGVFYIQNNNHKEALETLRQSKEMLEMSKSRMDDDKLKPEALELTINFNLALAYEKLSHLTEALTLHESIIQHNKYYIDSYVKIAQILHSLGQTHEAFQVLDKSIDLCSSLKLNSIRMDKLYCMKGHLQHLDGGNLDAKETLKKLGKNKYQYGAYYDICLGYETVIKKQLEMVTVKDFIRPNREYLINVCSSDHYNFYCYMLLTVLLVTDKKISKEQATAFFNQLKVAQLEIPEILFNFGLFQLLNDEYDGALSSFHRFREKSKSSKANEYIALAYYLNQNYEQCIRTLKRNISLEPNNIRFRYQLACALEKRLYHKFEKGKDVREMSKSVQTAEIARQIYQEFTKLSPGDYMRGVDNPHLKDHLRTEIGKIRSLCDERLRMINSSIKHYQKLEADMLEKDKIRKEEDAKRLDELEKAKQKKHLMEQLIDDEEQDEKERERQLERQRFLIEKSRRALAQHNKEWQEIEEANRLIKEQKKSKKTNPERKKDKKERKVQKAEEKELEEGYLSEDEFREDYKSQEDEYEEELGLEKEKPRKHKKRDRDDERRRHKKKNKERKVEREAEELSGGASSVEAEEPKLSDEEEVEEESLPRKKKKEEQEEEDELDLQKYMI